MPPESAPAFLEPQWFFPLFVVMWLTITGSLAHFGGWASFATVFRAENSVTGDRFRFASGSMGRRYLPVSYGNCLFVTVNSQGLYLSIFLPFRFQSPPLSIPGSHVESIEERRTLFFRRFIILVRDHWPRIALRGAPGQKAKEAYDAARVGMAL